jgi:hypothetical protein
VKHGATVARIDARNGAACLHRRRAPIQCDETPTREEMGVAVIVALAIALPTAPGLIVLITLWYAYHA